MEVNGLFQADIEKRFKVQQKNKDGNGTMDKFNGAINGLGR